MIKWTCFLLDTKVEMNAVKIGCVSRHKAPTTMASQSSQLWNYHGPQPLHNTSPISYVYIGRKKVTGVVVGIVHHSHLQGHLPNGDDLSPTGIGLIW